MVLFDKLKSLLRRHIFITMGNNKRKCCFGNVKNFKTSTKRFLIFSGGIGTENGLKIGLKSISANSSLNFVLLKHLQMFVTLLRLR